MTHCKIWYNTKKRPPNHFCFFYFSFAQFSTKSFEILDLSDLEACLISHIFVWFIRIFFGWLMISRNHRIFPVHPSFSILTHFPRAISCSLFEQTDWFLLIWIATQLVYKPQKENWNLESICLLKSSCKVGRLTEYSPASQFFYINFSALRLLVSRC